MSCSIELDVPKDGEQEIRRRDAFSKRPEKESMTKVLSSCPLHGASSINEQRSRCWSGISCGLSGCCCTKKQSKSTTLIKKIFEWNLLSSPDSHRKKDADKTWCKKRAQYYQHRMKISELVNDKILKQMQKKDLEVLESVLGRNVSTEIEVND